VQAALAKGDLVIGLSRNILDVHAKEVKAQTTPKLWTHERCLPLRCDVRLKPQIETAVKKCLEHFGRLDIVVKYFLHRTLTKVVRDGELWRLVRNKQISNYGHSLRRMCMARSMLFERRCRSYGDGNRRGILILLARVISRKVTNVAGIMGVPGLGPYCATKWAIEGLTESLSQELEGFGCKATIVEIGNAQRYFLTGIVDVGPTILHLRRIGVIFF
jgi:NAD(P)-dependent dehydrogenase (short-subunit alcohol dehydrogenase family)